jgi:putative transposase
MIAAVEQIVPVYGTKPACRALGVSHATVMRRRARGPASPRPSRKPSFRAVTPSERQEVLQTLHSERFVDEAPASVHATLLEEERYLCSVRTMYRILSACGEVRERRDQLDRPHYPKPELVARGPNQVWTWDITKLCTFVKWVFLYLYVILDLFSRYVVGWMLASCESHALAERLLRESLVKEGIAPGQLHLHADRGSSMRSRAVAQMLAELGVIRSHSRPHVSNDNPFSEAQFKTLKYRPDFPDRFGSFEHGLTYLRPFFHWYNCEHRHSGIAMLTPDAVHHGRAPEILARRQATLDAAYRAHPERFSRPPVAPGLPAEVWINPPHRGLFAPSGLPATSQDDPESTIVTLDGSSIDRNRGAGSPLLLPPAPLIILTPEA